MAEFPALPLWTDAYLADCAHLSDAEHGRYLLILFELWRAPDCRVLAGPGDPRWFSEVFAREGRYWAPGKQSARHVDWAQHPSRLLNSTWRRIRDAFLGANPRVCAYCGTTAAAHWEVDHVRARARGGTHSWSNLAVACRPCNRSKGARDG